MKAKLLPAVALALGLVAPLAAQYVPAPKPAAPAADRGAAAPATPAPRGATASTSAPTAPKPKADPKAAEPAPKIEGVAIARKDGRWLGLAVENGHFMLRFYDKDKKPEKQADAARATARWNPVNKAGDQRVILNPAGAALTAPQFVAPPLTFRVYLTLLDADGKSIESLSADMRDAAAK
jgi:hypothetical protein